MIGRTGEATAALRPCPPPPRGLGETLTGLSSNQDVPTFIAALLVDSWQLSLALLLVPMAACTAYVATDNVAVGNALYDFKDLRPVGVTSWRNVSGAWLRR